MTRSVDLVESRAVQSQSKMTLLPWPRRVVRRRGQLVASAGVLRARFGAASTPRLERAVDRLAARLRGLQAGFVVDVHCAHESAAHPALGDDESYRLEVAPTGVRLTAEAEWGVLRGLATLAQLCRRDAAGALVVPCCLVEDSPRFSWRGLMLDPARHFLPVALLERTLDAMWLAKLNVLHLHLSDDQGFRFPSRRFPALAETGGAGAFYSREELETLVARAADRGIRVVPELDVPGHCTSWLAAHPEWGPRAERTVPSRRFGVHRACLDPTRDTVYAALAELFSEVAAIFPDRCIHVGGDEVNPAWWRETPHVRDYMAERGIADVAALQAHFNARLYGIVAGLDRTLVGWDEIADESLPGGAIVQSWRGAASRDRALAAGFDCVFSAGYYLDLFYPADVHYRFDPDASPADLAAIEAALQADARLAHVRGGLGWATAFNAAADRGKGTVPPAPQPGRVLGGEACLWGELVDARVLNLRLWDRLPAVAERLWSSADVADPARLHRRIDAFVSQLARFAGVDLDAERRGALAALGLDEPERRALAPLLGAIEPVKWYARLLGAAALRARVEGHEAPAERPYTVDTPLDRIVDFLPAECSAARLLADLIAALGGERDAVARRRLRILAGHWRAQRRAFTRIAPRVAALRDLDTASVRLEALADVVDATLDGRVVPAVKEALALALEPSHEVVLGVAAVLACWLGDARVDPG